MADKTTPVIELTPSQIVDLFVSAKNKNIVDMNIKFNKETTSYEVKFLYNNQTNSTFKYVPFTKHTEAIDQIKHNHNMYKENVAIGFVIITTLAVFIITNIIKKKNKIILKLKNVTNKE